MLLKLHNLINEFLSEKEIENGLTIPFIVGSFLLIENKKYNSNTIYECINNFFDEDKYFNLQYCPKIKELVISNLNNEDEKIYLNNNKINKIKNILSTDNSLESIKNVEDFCIYISDIYNIQLKNSFFSKTKNNWYVFNSNEKRIINKITTANSGLQKWRNM